MHINDLIAAGRVAEAHQALRNHLIAQPEDVAAIELLGRTALHLGDIAAAVQAFLQLVALRPDADAYFCLGTAGLAAGAWPQAAAAFDQALSLDANHLHARFNLAWALRRQDRNAEAARHLEAVTAASPTHAEAWFNLGNAYHSLGRYADAAVALGRACALRPHWAEAMINLGLSLWKSGRIAEAEPILREAHDLAAGPESGNALANVLLSTGKEKEAEALYRDILSRFPHHPQTLVNLGYMLNSGNRLSELHDALPAAVACHGDDGALWNMCGLMWLDDNDLDRAEAAFQSALACRNDLAEAVANLGNVAVRRGDAAHAIEFFRRALEIEPENAQMHSNLLFTLQHSDCVDRAEIFAEHRRFGERHETLPPLVARAHAPKDPDRRLRVGFVSPDFRVHAVSFFFEPVLAGLDHGQMEVFLYMTRPFADSVTRRLQSLADHWRDLSRMDVSDAANAIVADHIDVLFDLAGHSAGNLLPAFARRLAPIQVSWLGYPGTTGLSRMDYRLLGRPASPDDLAFSSEKLELLIPSFQPPATCPPVSPPPMLTGRPPVFASLNKPLKITQGVLETWGRLLHAVPDARLLMVVPNADKPTIRDAWKARFDALGIAGDRIDFHPTCQFDEFLSLFADIDLALDPFPYCGGTTSLLTIWMGVPCITLNGGQENGDSSGLLLSGLGLGELVARTEDEYVAIAADLVADPARQVDLRASLRARLLASALMTETGTADALGKLIRRFWRDYVASSAV
ncbi:MAG: tetratricopeptide repeat protein [Bacteroidota bacterium]